MVRFLSRALGLLLLAAALVAVVIDTARSIAASAPTLTSFETAWFALDPASFSAAEQFIRVRAAAAVGDPASEPVISWVLAAPASAVLTVAGFLLVLAGAARRRRLPNSRSPESGARAAGDLP